MKPVLIPITLLLVICSGIALAQVPTVMNYQGRLTDNTPGQTPVDDALAMEFRIYDAAVGGNLLWSEKWASGVTVTNGIFSVMLGSNSSPLPSSVFTGGAVRYLEIDIGTETLLPRQQLGAAGWAHQATVALDADTVDGVEAAALEESMEIDSDIATHSSNSSAHHSRYSDAEAFSAVVGAGGAGSSLDADLLDGMEASELISAASDEVRTPISSSPIAIVLPGSYYLTGNLDGSGGGIDITTNNVTLDMMGFTLDGTGSTDHGIDVRGSSSVTIQNGKIRGFPLAGIINDVSSADVNQVINVQVLDNGTSGTTGEHSGIYLAGEFNHVEGCTAVGNGGYGIFVGAGSTLVNNTGEGISDADCPSVPPGCPATHALRDASTVYGELQTSLNAQDWTAVACNHATDAFIISDQGVIFGHGDIIAWEQGLASTFNGVTPTLIVQDTFQDTVRVLDAIDAGWITIPDRVRTFVIECGIITRATNHGLIVFTGPPP